MLHHSSCEIRPPVGQFFCLTPDMLSRIAGFMKLSRIVMTGATWMIASCFWQVSYASIPIAGFQMVDPGFYRGGQPREEGLLALEELGIRSIVDLRTTASDVVKEKRIAESLGLTHISAPIQSLLTPNDAEVEAILVHLANPALRPIFLHCRHGEDRTGLLVALYRHYDQNWTPQDAYAEMMAGGFHPILFNLQNYFFYKTDWEPFLVSAYFFR